MNLCIPGSNLGKHMIFFYYFFLLFFYVFFFCHYYYSANLQIQHYCLYSDSPTLLPLMMPRPPAPSAWVRYPVWQHTFVFPSAFSRRAVVSYWRKYVHEVLVNRLGGLSLPRKRVVRLTDRPDMTLDVYRGRKTTMQQQQQAPSALSLLSIGMTAMSVM